MTLYVYTGLILVIIAFIFWVFNKGKTIGYQKGKEDSDEEWKDKINVVYTRATDPTDDGINVSDGSVWESLRVKTGERVESSSGTQGPTG